MGGDLCGARLYHDIRSFNPRPHMGGDDGRPDLSLTSDEFQSTPPHGGRRKDIMIELTDPEFQSTPPHGGRHHAPGARLVFLLFQSTPPHGGRHGPLRVLGGLAVVSIHAPIWGATRPLASIWWGTDGFNPRPHMGGDILVEMGKVKQELFQSTPPYGGRLQNLS